MSDLVDGVGTVFDSVIEGAGSIASDVQQSAATLFSAAGAGLDEVGTSIEDALSKLGVDPKGELGSMLGASEGGDAAAGGNGLLADGGGVLEEGAGGSDATLGAGRPDWAGPGAGDAASPGAEAPGAAAGTPTVGTNSGPVQLTSGPGNAGSGGGGIPGGAGPEAGAAPASGAESSVLGDTFGKDGFVPRNGLLLGGVAQGLGTGIVGMAKGQQEIALAKARQGIYSQNYGGGGGSGGPVTVSPPRIAGKNGLLFNPAGQPTAAPGTTVSAGPGLPATAAVQGPARIQRFDTNFNGEWVMDPGSGQVKWVSAPSAGAAA